MEKVRPWCDQPSDQGRLKNKIEENLQSPGDLKSLVWT